jgi:hypothetical protein
MFKQQRAPRGGVGVPCDKNHGTFLILAPGHLSSRHDISCLSLSEQTLRYSRLSSHHGRFYL